MNRLVKTLVVAAPLAVAASLSTNSADACGGCFIAPTENTVVSGHRMALSISMQRTVLWDQIQYQGDPEEFSWVLPIKPGARIELADNAWFEALESGTVTTVTPPPLQCANGSQTFGCGSGAGFAAAEFADGAGAGGFEDPVTVVKKEVVGPYEAVTLSSEDPAALTAWLESHNYAIPDDVKPVIAAYVGEGFDFIAMRLIPGNGVNLMAPVRVITEGASPVLPLRMVAAGTGPFTSVILYVIGEGRWTTSNFPELRIPYEDLTWDGATNESNYGELRDQVLGFNNGRTWISTYAQPDGLFSGDGSWTGDGWASSGMGLTYMRTVVDESGSGWDQYSQCEQAALSAASQSGIVVDTCDPDTNECGEPAAGQIDARSFTCGELTDLSVALVGMHPPDVWVTRLEANLPRAALAEDLSLAANDDQSSVDNNHITPNTVNYECPAAPLNPSKDGKGPVGNGTPVVLVGLGALAALLAARRRSLVSG
jgi:hypothetical protein